MVENNLRKIKKLSDFAFIYTKEYLSKNNELQLQFSASSSYEKYIIVYEDLTVFLRYVIFDLREHVGHWQDGTVVFKGNTPEEVVNYLEATYQLCQFIETKRL